jgi:ABC-type transport system involved in multi-copper enzyme maturation permease subunit
MPETVAVFRYEYLMQIRRWGLWIGLFLTCGLFLFLLLQTAGNPRAVPSEYTTQPWALATLLIEEFTLFAPIAAGILAADRFPRDRQMGMSELINSSLPSRLPLVLGKYAGSLLAMLTPPIILLLLSLVYLVVYFHQPAVFLTAPVVLLAVALPSWLFVVAWSLAFPLIMPLRLYQVLFAGFWMWAVAVPPTDLPTINQSILSVDGQYAHFAFFINDPIEAHYLRPPATVGLAVVNMALIVGLSVVALALIPVVLRWQEQRP